jgi:hypothetical protein
VFGGLRFAHPPYGAFRLMEIGMFTCFIRYTIDPDNLDDFREYARSWISLIRKYGGIHHGYFLPGKEEDLPDATFSFPGLGTEGPQNIAVALFSFPILKHTRNIVRT